MNLPRLQLPDLSDFCRRWRIQKLEVFGSALRDDFSPDRDIDILYTFEPNGRPKLPGIIEMESEIRRLLGRRVDFIPRLSIERSRNPIRKHEILSTAQVLYAA